MHRGIKTAEYRWLSVLILLVGFGLRVAALGRASLWYDEVFTEVWVQSSLSRSIDLILEIGNHTPLYYVLLRLFPTSNEFLLRFPSALAGVSGIAVLMFVARRIYRSQEIALVAGAVLATNPYHVWLSHTARPYTVLFLFTLLASYFFVMLVRRERSRLNWAGFIVCSMAAYMTQIFSLVLPMAQYFFFPFIMRSNRRFFRQWIGAQFIAGIPLMIWFYALLRREFVSVGIGWIPRPGVVDLPLTAWNMLVGYDGSSPWYVILGLIPALGGLLAGLVYAVRQRRTDRTNFYWFWLVTATLLVTFAVSQFRPLYVDRYFVMILPGMIFLMIEGWRRLPRRWIAAGVVIAVGVVNVAVTLDRGIEQKENWRAAAAYVQAERQPGDGLLSETPITMLVFIRYFGDREMARAWLEGGPTLEDQYTSPVQRIWAIYRNPRDDGHRQGVLDDFDPFAPSDSPMPGWLAQYRDQVVQQRVFNGVTVLLVDVGDDFTGLTD